ncbi:hypothetical protein [Methylobacter sp.]|uniref:hypothetical protein n=1 Tax=Methylobacter sp. TaxID=2051955 RepID=UPI003DA22BE3
MMAKYILRKEKPWKNNSTDNLKDIQKNMEFIPQGKTSGLIAFNEDGKTITYQQ